MNFLAHTLLGYPDSGLIAGGFIGDFVKGPVSDKIPLSLQRGIKLHRRIDSISNQLPSMRSSYIHFGKSLRRFAPILLDVVADHVLARKWKTYGNEYNLETFTSIVYRDIRKFDLPPNSIEFYEHMSNTDLLGRYVETTTIENAMRNILKRLDKAHLAPQLNGLLEAKINNFENDFKIYFPQIKNATKEYLSTIRYPLKS